MQANRDIVNPKVDKYTVKDIIHIYRKSNQEVGQLSKKVCFRDPGSLLIRVSRGGEVESLPPRLIDL